MREVGIHTVIRSTSTLGASTLVSSTICATVGVVSFCPFLFFASSAIPYSKSRSVDTFFVLIFRCSGAVTYAAIRCGNQTLRI